MSGFIAVYSGTISTRVETSSPFGNPGMPLPCRSTLETNRYVLLATLEGDRPAAKAAARSVVVELTGMAPVYAVPVVAVGSEPSVV